jgi:L-amino acid N-acyltransferase YncA
MSEAPAALRRSRAADVAAIAAIYGHHVQNGVASFEEAPPSVEEIGRRRADIVAQGLPYLVAEGGGRVLGYSYAGPFRTRSAYRYTLEDSVYVAPDAVGRGIGRLLLDAVVARSAELGYRQMVAVIGGSETIPSIRLHQALGFVHIGVLPAIGFKFGRWIDVVLMQRALGPGAATRPG